MKKSQVINENNNASLLIISTLVILVLSLGIFMHTFENNENITGYSVFSNLFNKITGQNSPNLGPNENDVSTQATCPSGGTCFYIRDGATGTSCSDWTTTNACDSLPATLQRGATYYIASGSYSGRTFNTAYNNDGYITIKKATDSEHGTDTGWISGPSGYGDGQATFTSGISITSSYWIFNGSIGSMSKDPMVYGFTFSVMSKPISLGQPGSSAAFGADTTNLIISHVSATAPSGDVEKFFIQTGNYHGETDNVTISSNYLSGWQNGYWATSGSAKSGTKYMDNWLFEYNVALNGYSTGANHGEWINNNYAQHNNQVTRYNLFEGMDPNSGCMTGMIVANNNDNINAKVYGNVFKNVEGCNGLITGTSAGNLINVSIYDNTFVDNTMAYANPAISGPGSGVAYNNLFYGNRKAETNNYGTGIDSIVHDYNYFYPNIDIPSESHIQIGSGDPFVSSASGDFHLKNATSTGITIPFPYNIDPDGVTRGSDGTWDRGAYEFGGVVTPINALCGTNANTCNPGNVFGQTTNSSSYVWQCLGLNGGINKSCSSLLVPIAGQCGLNLDSCTFGTYLNISDNSTDYIWQCNGIYGGANKSCNFDRTTISITQTGAISVNVPSTGTYILSAYVNAPDNTTNSFYVDFDSNPGTGNPGTDNNKTWDIYPNNGNFFLSNVSWRGLTCDSTCSAYNPKNWALTAGTHTLYINDRESTISNIQWVKLVKISGQASQYHPADLNTDLAVSLNEFTNYSSYFKLARSWPIAPSPPDANYYSRAYFLLKRGLALQGAYSYNASASCPSCFIVR